MGTADPTDHILNPRALMTIPATYEAARVVLFGDETFPEEIDGANRSVSPPTAEEDEDFDEDDFGDEEPTHGPAGPTFVARLDDYDDVHSFVAESLGESLMSIPALRGFYDATLSGSLERRGERYILSGELCDQDGDARGMVTLVIFGSPDGIVVVSVGMRLHYEGQGVFEEVAQVPSSTFYDAEGHAQEPTEGEWFLGF